MVTLCSQSGEPREVGPWNDAECHMYPTFGNNNNITTVYRVLDKICFVENQPAPTCQHNCCVTAYLTSQIPDHSTIFIQQKHSLLSLSILMSITIMMWSWAKKDSFMSKLGGTWAIVADSSQMEHLSGSKKHAIAFSFTIIWHMNKHGTGCRLPLSNIISLKKMLFNHFKHSWHGWRSLFYANIPGV